MTLPGSVPSPLTGRNAPLVNTLTSARSIDGYRREFDFDVSKYFIGIPEFGVYQCDTGYRFFYPFTLTADESLYRCLEGFEYEENKWEFSTALAQVRGQDRLLDVGCGEGSFLAKAKDKGALVSGMELNGAAAAVARGKGITVHEELLDQHDRQGYYDIVTSFQVLEHVPAPMAFLRGCVRVLRPGGTLVIGVPNDDGFLRLDPGSLLNQPPHHMGLWNRASLTAVAALIGLEIKAFEIQPLAELGWYQAVIENAYLKGWRKRLFYRLGFADFLRQYIRENAHTIAGHSILVIYQKPLP